MIEHSTALVGIPLVLGEFTDTFFGSIQIVFSWPVFGYLLLGILIGITFGALPGIGGVVGMAILLPLTLPLTGFEANILLVSIYSGAMYGACVSSILINVPGSAAAAATIFDGFPMTRQGRAIDALGISATSSALGGALMIVALFLFTPFLARVVLLFGSPQVFLIAFLGIAMIAVIARRSGTVKGIVAGAYGLLVMTIGISPTLPVVRFDFDSMLLYDGLSYVAILIGMFAVGEMIRFAGEEGTVVSTSHEIAGSVVTGVKDALSRKFTMVKSAFIGMVIGSIPGAGASASNFFSYSEALRSSNDPDSFGSGNPTGVVAAEAANNGTVAGSLIPTIAFGIPGSASTAVLLGGFLMHGLNPGPQMFGENLIFTYSLFTALLVGNAVILVVGLLIVTRLGGFLTSIDTDIIIPFVIVLAVLGAFVLRVNWIDLVTIFIFGIIAYYMVEYNFSIIAMVLGAVLAEIAEENLYRSLRLTDEGALIFFQEPLSIIIILMIIAVLFGSFIKEQLNVRFLGSD